MRKNKKYLLSSFDAIVFTDYIQHTLFEYRKNKKKPSFIFLSHGFAGRAYSYKKDLLDFDLNLISGKFSYNQLKERKLLSKQTSMIGYQKIDAIKSQTIKTIFNNKKPVVLYNPHFTPPFSSWHFYGLEVLDFFYKNSNYNLIFAPHINLFTFKGKEKKATIPDKFFNTENIYIDLGSIKSVDMTYTNQADIYLGDVSSQVYEFILKPRPCIFFNPRNIDYKKDSHYRFWKCGEVINTSKNLDKSLQNIEPNFNKFKKVQERINKENVYSEQNSTATQRAAKTINIYLSTLEDS
jgi:CDP-glycerol glycerophosphotransferase (TagB/SpsB family)